MTSKEFEINEPQSYTRQDK